MTTKRGDMPAHPCQQTVNRDTGDLQPHQFGNDDFVVAGLTIREQFAMAIAQGLVTAQSQDGEWNHDAQTIAQTAFEYADAMLDESERTK